MQKQIIKNIEYLDCMSSPKKPEKNEFFGVIYIVSIHDSKQQRKTPYISSTRCRAL